MRTVGSLELRLIPLYSMTKPIVRLMKAAIKPTARRRDGTESRERLLRAAIKLFAENGFVKTSTREIARVARINVSAIQYYFVDKAGLYRAALSDPIGHIGSDPTLLGQPGANLRDSLRSVLAGYVEPQKRNEVAQQCMLLHFRELFEPTGLWDQEIESSIKPTLEALLVVLCRHLGIPVADDDLHRLAFSLFGLYILFFWINYRIMVTRPALSDAAESICCNTKRLDDYALAMVQAEARRRVLLQ